MQEKAAALDRPAASEISPAADAALPSKSLFHPVDSSPSGTQLSAGQPESPASEISPAADTVKPAADAALPSKSLFQPVDSSPSCK